MKAKKSVSMKLVVILLAVVLLIGCAAGGTLAWLIAEAGEVTNTFTVGNITITLDEETTKEVNYVVVPGASQNKQPKITVKKGSEKCYVYASVTNNLVIDNTTVATLDIDTTQWILVGSSGNECVYRYKDVVDASSADVEKTVFTKVTYDKEEITEKNINSLQDETIVVDAYAHQSENVEQTTVDAAACTYFEVTAVTSTS